MDQQPKGSSVRRIRLARSRTTRSDPCWGRLAGSIWTGQPSSRSAQPPDDGRTREGAGHALQKQMPFRQWPPQDSLVDGGAAFGVPGRQPSSDDGVKTFYFVGGPTHGHEDAFFRRLVEGAVRQRTGRFTYMRLTVVRCTLSRRPARPRSSPTSPSSGRTTSEGRSSRSSRVLDRRRARRDHLLAKRPKAWRRC